MGRQSTAATWLRAPTATAALLVWFSLTCSSLAASAADENNICFVTGKPPAHVATELTARYVPDLRPGDPSCCSGCEAYDVAVRWTNASVAALWRVFDDRRRETEPNAPLLMDFLDSAKIEDTTICSQLVRYPQCIGHATAFLATLACLPGAARFETGTPADEGEGKFTFPSAVNSSAAAAVRLGTSATANETSSSGRVTESNASADQPLVIPKRTIRICRSLATDMFDACRSVKMMGFTTVEVGDKLMIYHTVGPSDPRCTASPVTLRLLLNARPYRFS